MSLMDWVRKIQDVIMPIEPQYEDEPEEPKAAEKTPQAQAQEQTQQAQVQQQTQAQSLVETMEARRAAAGGGNVSTPASNVRHANFGESEKTPSRPNLKLIKAPEFVMKIYQPSDYNLIQNISDDVLSRKAVVVNYEYIRPEEQRRFCDYIEGVCYAIDGSFTKISERIFLYTPSGISTNDIAELVASVRYR